MYSQLGRLVLIAVAAATAACSIQLVAPYNSELQQKASSMEAEVSSWELTMYQGAGTVADDPRNPEVRKTLNKWRGEADAMLTLVVSADPGTVNCNQAAKDAYIALKDAIPEKLRAPEQSEATPSPSTSVSSSSCETKLVADLNDAMDDLAKALEYCKVEWAPDEYFLSIGQNGAATAKLPAATSDAQDELKRHCLSEFKNPYTSTSSTGTEHTTSPPLARSTAEPYRIC